MRNVPNVLGALVLLIAGGIHLYRYFEKVPVKFGEFDVPMEWSLPSGVLLILIALWMLVVIRK